MSKENPYETYYSFMIDDIGLCKTSGKFKYNDTLECIEVVANYEYHEDYHEYYHFIKSEKGWIPDSDDSNYDDESADILAKYLNEYEPPESIIND